MEQNAQSLIESLTPDMSSGIEQVGLLGFILVMGASMISSFLISALYLKFYGSRATGSQIHRAFPLIGMSVTAIFICIQFSLPLSLGLLGALSIVRFRTPIKEPEEIGFIMLVIAASISISTFSLNFLLILILFAVLALYLQRTGFSFISRDHEDGTLLLSVPSGNEPGVLDAIGEILARELIRARIESVTRSGGNALISYTFRGLTENDPIGLQRQLNELIGEGEVDVYMNKQATL